jgi:hypothetical protein
MNMLTLVGFAGANVPTAGGASLGDSCALFLFLSGAVSLAIAAYLLYRAPKFQPMRVLRRR